jgi:hypothetical protein
MKLAKKIQRNIDFSIDGIYPPEYLEVEDQPVDREKSDRTPPLHRVSGCSGFWKKFFAIALIYVFGGSLAVSVGQIGYTASYSHDREVSEDNTLVGSSLDFATLVSIDGAFRTFIAPGEGNQVSFLLSFFSQGDTAPAYRVTTEKIAGNDVFCGALVATTSGPFAYEGPLLELETDTVPDVDAWTLEILFTDDESVVYGDECTFDLIYNGEQPDTPEDAGYTDEEYTRITLVADVGGFEILETQEFAPAPFFIQENEGGDENNVSEESEGTEEEPEDSEASSKTEESDEDVGENTENESEQEEVEEPPRQEDLSDQSSKSQEEEEKPEETKEPTEESVSEESSEPAHD